MAQPFAHLAAASEREDSDSVAAPEQRRVPLVSKLFYGVGSLAYGIKDNGFSTLLLLFYNQVVGLPAGLVGLAIFTALVLDAFIDPVIGHLSDHCRSRWGRRHPFMYASAVPVGVLYLLLWNPPAGASHLVTMAYLVVVAILVRSAISCYEVPSSALTPELTSDYHERTSILGYRYLFGWLGGVGMLLIAFAIFLAPTPSFPVGQLNPAGYRHYAVCAAVLMMGAILLSAIGTHREIGRLPKASPTRTSLGGTLRGVRTAFANRAFRILLVSGMFSNANLGLIFALTTYFNTFLWGFSSGALAIFTLCILLGVAVAFGFVTIASRRWGKRLVAVWSAIGYCVLASAPLLLRVAGVFPANGTPALLPVLMVFFVLTITFGVGGTILGSSMISDVVEDSQMRTGQRQEGVFFAGSFFMQKCVTGVGLLLSGAILSAVHFPAAATPGTVPGIVLTHLVVTFCGLTVLLGFAAAVVMARYPLGEDDHRQRLAELAEVARRATPLPGSEPEILAVSE